MSYNEGTIARPPDAVPCENPECGQSILLDESFFSPDEDTPTEQIHVRYDPKVASFAALCRHFTVSISTPGQDFLSSLNATPGD